VKTKTGFNEFVSQELAKEPEANMRPNDGLLAQAQMQWQFGDWGSLGKLDHEELNKHPNKGMLALLSAAAHLQMGNIDLAKACLYSAQAGGCSQQLIAKILISGVHNTLGRAFAIHDQLNKASSHFEAAVDLSPMPLDVRLVQKARKSTELGRLGIPVFGDLTSAPDTFHVDQLLRQALFSAPKEPALLIAAAESAQRHGKHQEAIKLWQKLAALDGERMPQSYYDRLNQAYASIDGFPLGLPEEEQLRGDGDKHEILKRIHQLLQPKNYLEIGVQAGKSLALASCPAIGVDPMLQIKSLLGPHAQMVRATSDEFFESRASEMISAPLELVFIDGMHLFEYALRDFINTEKYAEAHTVVVIDDIFPGHPAQAERDRRTRAWTGDVWKLLVTLQQHRPDLKLLMLDVFPTGLLCITGLNRNDNTLQMLYDEVLQRFDPSISPSDDILMRRSAVSCKSGQLEQFIEDVKVVRGYPKHSHGHVASAISEIDL
jgi:tetratricopeptide (TPR) repeat protein